MLARLNAALCVLLVLACFAVPSCGGHGGSAASLDGPPDAVDSSTDLGKALAELDALAVPAGADAKQFAVLKSKLRELLLAKGSSKTVATAPTSARSKVGYFSIAGNGGTANLFWTYRNEGDFNLDGTVNIADLSPLGIHFGKDTSSSDWQLARMADGNMDGRVNIADLTSLGANFLRRVEGYYLQYSATYTGGSWSNSATLSLGTYSSIPEGYGFRTCAVNVTSGMVTGFYRLVPFDGGSDGIASDIVAYPATNYYESEPNDESGTANVLPAFPFPTPVVDGNLGTGNHYGDVDGDDADIFYTTATADGLMSFTMSLDSMLGDMDLFLFAQGGTDPISSSQGLGDIESVSANVTGGTSYYILIQRYSGYGEYQLFGTFTPGGVNQPPVAGLIAQPASGTAPLSTTLNASSSTDDGTIVKFEYDFGEGGGFQDYGTDQTVAHNYANAGNYTAQVRVTDNGGLTDTASTTVSVTSGGGGGISGTVLTDAGRPFLVPSEVFPSAGEAIWNIYKVTVSLSGGVNLTTSPNSSGYYEFTSVPAGTYTVAVTCNFANFEPPSRSVTVSGSAVTGQDFTAHINSSSVPYEFKSGNPPNTVVHPSIGTTIDIYYEPGTAIGGWNSWLEDAFKSAVVRWNLVGDPWNLFHVQFTDNIGNAEIWVHYVQSLGSGVLGMAYWSGYDGQINLPMEIQMATEVFGGSIDAETERKAAIHEVGHSLGLWSHSDSTSDIMYPVASQEWPSVRDLYTIYTLYNQLPDWTTGGRKHQGGNEEFMEFWIE